MVEIQKQEQRQNHRGDESVNESLRVRVRV